MPNRYTRNCSRTTEAEIMAAWLEDREDELLDAAITAAALVARADGYAEPAERTQMVDFLSRKGNPSALTRADMIEAFEHRLRHFEERGGAETAVRSLERVARRPPARLVVDTAERVAAADGHLHPREFHMLQLIRLALRARPPRGVAQA
jgi:tellurite resistance protein